MSYNCLDILGKNKSDVTYPDLISTIVRCKSICNVDTNFKKIKLTILKTFKLISLISFVILPCILLDLKLSLSASPSSYPAETD